VGDATLRGAYGVVVSAVVPVGVRDAIVAAARRHDRTVSAEIRRVLCRHVADESSSMSGWRSMP
jgi:hypothetical protein